MRCKVLPWLVLLLMVPSPGWGEESTYAKEPNDRDLLQEIRKAHPRLLAELRDFEEKKARMNQDAALRKRYEKVREEARRILGERPCTYSLNRSEGMLSVSRSVLQRVYCLALVYRMEGEKRFALRAWKELEAAARFPDWHPGHFLDTAEMCHAFAVGYDWLNDAWSREQRDLLRRAMVLKGLEPAMKAYADPERSGWWVGYPGNWNLVCNSGIGLAALAVLEEEPLATLPALKCVLASLPAGLSGFSPDGGWPEGPLYWGYGTFYLCTFIAALEKAVGTDLGLSESPGLSRTGLFPVYLTSPAGLFNFADSPERIPWSAQGFWFSRRFGLPVSAWFARQARGTHALHVLWWDPQGLTPKAANLPPKACFEGGSAKVATLRTDWEEPEGVFIGFTAGGYTSGHGHLDAGSFVLDAGGRRWALDLGMDDYDLSGYFGKNRWDYYRVRAEGHNTLVINPGAGPDQEWDPETRILRCESRPEGAFVVSDLTGAYRRWARRVRRGVSLLNRSRVLVQDEIQTVKPAELWWFFHTKAEVDLDLDKKIAVLRQGSAALTLRILSPARARFQVGPARPLASSPHPLSQAENTGVSRIAIHLKEVENERLAVLLTPLGDSRVGFPEDPVLCELEEW